MGDEAILERLDTIIALLHLSNMDAIAEARKAIRTDPVNAAILDFSTSQVPAGQLKTAVAKKTKQSGPTINRRLAALVELGVLRKYGGGASTAYKSTGLI
jgi:hypothetical protein